MRRNEPGRNPRAPFSRSRVSTGGKNNPTPPVRPTPPADAGPRPVSAQQRAYLDLTQGRQFVNDPPMPVTLPVPEPSSRRVTHRRDATVRRKRMVLNRRRPNYPLIALRYASCFLAVEVVAALLFSPRLAVRSVNVTGNQAVPAAQVLALATPHKGQNLFRFPTGSVQDAILRDPTVETVEIERRWPDEIRIRLHERQPWASVQTPDGSWFTIDSKLVPFRKGTQAEEGLPRLVLAIAPVNGKLPPVKLGKKMTEPGLSEVSQCLEWAKNRPDFPMESVAIDPSGKLCFNRVGGTQVLLGSASDLPRKLNVLALLMQHYPITDAAYVNLYAYDSPAVMPKSAVATASAKTHSTNSSPSSRQEPDSGTVDKTSELP